MSGEIEGGGGLYWVCNRPRITMEEWTYHEETPTRFKGGPQVAVKYDGEIEHGFMRTKAAAVAAFAKDARSQAGEHERNAARYRLQALDSEAQARAAWAAVETVPF